MVEVTVPNIATQNKIRSNKLITPLHTLHLKPEPYNSSQSSSLSQPGRATPTISTPRPCHREPTCRRSVSSGVEEPALTLPKGLAVASPVIHMKQEPVISTP